MKKLFLLSTCLFSFSLMQAQSVFDLKIKTFSGDSIAISQFAGKKTLFVIVPLNQHDAAYQQLQSFKTRYADSVNIVGIVSKEDGDQTSQATSLSNLYSAMGITLTEAVYTRKTSGANQAPLLQWLTNKEKNHHFNNDAAGIGSKFFIGETGRLFAVLPPQASLQMPMIDRIVHSSPGSNQ